jgi:hypothetical protein
MHYIMARWEYKSIQKSVNTNENREWKFMNLIYTRKTLVQQSWTRFVITRTLVQMAAVQDFCFLGTLGFLLSFGWLQKYVEFEL